MRPTPKQHRDTNFLQKKNFFVFWEEFNYILSDLLGLCIGRYRIGHFDDSG